MDVGIAGMGVGEEDPEDVVDAPFAKPLAIWFGGVVLADIRCADISSEVMRSLSVFHQSIAIV